MPTISFHRALLALAWVLALLLGLVFAAITVDSHREATEHARQISANLANTIEENIRRTFDFYDRSLQGMVEELADPATMALPPRVRDRVIFDKAVSVPGLSGVAVLDAAGDLVMAAPDMGGRRLNAAEREYFQVHKARADIGLFVSAPLVSKYNSEPAVVLSRRRLDENGRFAGIVTATIRVRYFNEQFNAVNLGPGARITLLRDDGVIVSRLPYDEKLIGTSLAKASPVERYVRGETFFTSPSTLDNSTRIYYFKAFAKYPLFISVAQPTETVYADWRRRSVWLGLTTLLLMGACLGLAWLFLRELKHRHKTTLQLRGAERDLRTMLDGLPSMVAYWDRHLLIRFANSSYLETFGVSRREVDSDHPGVRTGQRLPGTNARYVEEALKGQRQAFETPLTDGEGRRRHVLVSFVPDAENGEVQGVFVQATDITDRKAAENLLFEEKERARVTLASIGDAVITTDAQGHVTYLNPVAEKMSGWSLHEALGRDVESVVPLYDGQGDDPLRMPIRLALRDRRIVPPSNSATLVNRRQMHFDIEDTAAPIEDREGRVVGAVMVLRDVTQARAMALRMAHLAQYDALTGLPNRVLLLDRASQATARARRDGTGFALMYLDLDGFKDVNDSMGHDAGDALLIEFARRLSGALRQSDTLSRQGGDEFVVLAPMVPDTESAHALADKLVRLAAQPFLIQGRELRVTTSLGIALFPEDGATFDLLARHADAAMYNAKRSGKNQFRFFTGDIGRAADQQLLRDHTDGGA